VSDFTLREGRSSDRPFLLEVLALSALASYPALEKLGRLSLRTTLEAFHAQYDVPGKRVWIAEREGIRAAGLWGIPSIHPILEEPELLIVAIATLPEYRGQGLAHALLDHAATHARQERMVAIRLFANPENAAAMALYRSLGFAPLSIELRKALI